MPKGEKTVLPTDLPEEPWSLPSDPWWFNSFLTLIRAGKTIEHATAMTGIAHSTPRTRVTTDPRFRRLYSRARAEAHPRKVHLYDEKLLKMADNGNLAALKLWASYHIPEVFRKGSKTLQDIEPDTRRVSIDGANGPTGMTIEDMLLKSGNGGFGHGAGGNGDESAKG